MFRHARTTASFVIALLALSSAPAVASTTASARSFSPETPAIVNGSTVPQSEFDSRWPFIVAIVNPKAKTQFDGQFCGGTLIDDQHVVTAAHCVQLRPGVLVNSRSVGIIAKSRVLDDATMGSGETGLRVVSDVFVHPQFSDNAGGGFRFDVAVLRLRDPITGSTPIGLVQAGDTAAWGAGGGGTNALIAGWGNTDPLGIGTPGAAYPTALQQATVPVQADSLCAASVGGGYGSAYERATNLCAGTLRTAPRTLGIDSCQGDSGGPLIVDIGAGVYKLAGVTSWGEGCAEKNFGAYTRVDALRDWIDSIPGATDGGAGIGGPAGLQEITNLRSTGSNFDRVTLSWDPPATGLAPERYAIWRRTTFEGDIVDELVAITRDLTHTSRVPASRSANSEIWNVRPLDAAGSNGPSSLLIAGPKADRIRPSRPGRVSLSRYMTDGAILRWFGSRDAHSGMAGYVVQRRVLGRSGWAFAAYTRPGQRSVRIGALRAGERFQVRVKALDQAGNSSAYRTSEILRVPVPKR